jgi:hypothetical protein
MPRSKVESQVSRTALAEELYVEEGPAKLPIKHAADQALATFGEVKLDEILPLDIPFSSITLDSKTKRNEYITLGLSNTGQLLGVGHVHLVQNTVCILQLVVHVSMRLSEPIALPQVPRLQALHQRFHGHQPLNQ